MSARKFYVSRADLAAAFQSPSSWIETECECGARQDLPLPLGMCPDESITVICPKCQLAATGFEIKWRRLVSVDWWKGRARINGLEADKRKGTEG